MKKNFIRGYITLAVIFVVYTVISFAFPFKRTGLFWFAYLSAVVAIALQIYVIRLSFGSGNGAKSKFYGFPIARVGVIYLVAQLLAGILEMALASVAPTWIFVIINVVLLAFAVIGCIASDAMREEIERQDIKIKVDVEKMRALQSMSAALVSQCQTEEMKKEMQKLADEVRYSDPVTCAASVEAELELTELMVEIQKAVIDNEPEAGKALCGRVMSVLGERNRICKLNK